FFGCASGWELRCQRRPHGDTAEPTSSRVTEFMTTLVCMVQVNIEAPPHSLDMVLVHLKLVPTIAPRESAAGRHIRAQWLPPRSELRAGPACLQSHMQRRPQVDSIP